MNARRLAGTIVYTDLDGSLLDYEQREWGPAGGAVSLLLARGCAVVFCSSKTLAEQRVYRTQLDIGDPMIVEDGSAVAVPRGYFSRSLWVDTDIAEIRRSGDFDVLMLGVDSAAVFEGLREIRTTEGVAFRGYSDMTLKEVRQATGLTGSAARRARDRDFSETVTVEGGNREWRRFMEALERHGLHSFGDGPTGTVVAMGVDKGRAVGLLTLIYRRAASAAGVAPGALRTVGIGNAANDEPMLRAVDRAFLVEAPTGGWVAMTVPGLERIEGAGPVGWSRAAARVLHEGILA